MAIPSFPHPVPEGCQKGDSIIIGADGTVSFDQQIFEIETGSKRTAALRNIDYGKAIPPHTPTVMHLYVRVKPHSQCPAVSTLAWPHIRPSKVAQGTVQEQGLLLGRVEQHIARLQVAAQAHEGIREIDARTHRGMVE